MKLQNSYTKPSVRTTLSFSEDEVIEALINHAKKQGYLFNDERTSIWFPDKRNHYGSESTKLVINCLGNMPGINKP